MPAVLIYFSNHPRCRDGALQQANALKQDLGPGAEIVGIIRMIGDDPESDQDKEIARRFSILAMQGRPVIALIVANNRHVAYWRLASVLPPDTPVVHPSQLAIIGAVERPYTPEEWEGFLDFTVWRFRETFRLREQAAPVPTQP